jgi:hypothetical protein
VSQGRALEVGQQIFGRLLQRDLAASQQCGVPRATAIRPGAVSREENGGHQEGGLEARRLLAIG